MSDGKLVRDLIPDLIRQSGRTVEVRYLTGDELKAALGAKLIEEAQEAAEVVHSRKDLVEELADVREVVAALIAAVGITEHEGGREGSSKGPGARGLSLRRVVGLVQFHDRLMRDRHQPGHPCRTAARWCRTCLFRDTSAKPGCSQSGHISAAVGGRAGEYS